MTGEDFSNEFASDFDRMDRPLQMAPGSELSQLSDLPEHKKTDPYPTTSWGAGNWDTENPYATTDFRSPYYVQDDEWW